MPTNLPLATSISAPPSGLSIRPFGLSCSAIGAAATPFAAILKWVCTDRTGAILILLMVGCFFGLLLRSIRKERAACGQ